MRSPIYNLTAISTILWIITVIATSVFGSGSNMQLYSACSHKHVHVYQNGSVFANDDSQTPLSMNCQKGSLNRIDSEILTISTDKMFSNEDDRFRVTLYAQEVGMYLCFNKKWKLIGLKRRKACGNCHFIETIAHGYVRYASADDETKFIGFRKVGRPIRYHRTLKSNHSKKETTTTLKIDESCYNFVKRPIHSPTRSIIKMPILCANNTYNKVPMVNTNQLRNNSTPYRVKQKRRKLDKKVKQNLEVNHTELSVVTPTNYNLQTYTNNNATDLYTNSITNKINLHSKNRKKLVPKNTEKNIYENFDENANKLLVTAQQRHKLRHSHSRHHHSKRSPRQKGLEIQGYL